MDPKQNDSQPLTDGNADNLNVNGQNFAASASAPNPPVANNNGSYNTPTVIQPDSVDIPAVQPLAIASPEPAATGLNSLPASGPTLQVDNANTGPVGVVPQAGSMPRKSKKKKLLLSGFGAFLILAGSLGYVYGFYLPNKPENVYQTGLERSGETLNKLVNEFTAADKLKRLENSEMTASAEIKSPDVTFNGSFGVKLSKTKSDGSLDIKFKSGSEPEKALLLKFLSDLPQDKKFPNFYFQITGLKELGLEFLSPEILAYEGKWIAVESDYLESLSDMSGDQTPKSRENITSEEVAGLVRTISSTTNEYLLTSNKEKTVLENKAFLGKEITDGIDAYRYQVGINKPNVLKFCVALSERVISDPAFRKITNMDDTAIEEEKKNIPKSCEQAAESIVKDDPKIELWVDAKYKLVHKLRVFEKNNDKSYADIGQTYKGGDQINFFVAYHDETRQADARFAIDVDTKSYVSKGVITWAQKGNNAFDAKITFDAKPYNGEVKAEKPVGAISIQEIMDKFVPTQTGPTPAPQPATTTANRARDTERQTDIKAIHGQLEAHYAQNGFYPKLTDINSTSWRATNMNGLDAQALKDPNGTLLALALSATNKQYGYTPAGCGPGGSECLAYTLTAILSTGEKYTKVSLN